MDKHYKCVCTLQVQLPVMLCQQQAYLHSILPYHAEFWGI